jgi:hypothetical protein
MVVGQDMKFSRPSSFPNPEKNRGTCGTEGDFVGSISRNLIANPEIIEFFNERIQALINPKRDLSISNAFSVQAVVQAFEVGEEMTASLMVMGRWVTSDTGRRLQASSPDIYMLRYQRMWRRIADTRTRIRTGYNKGDCTE